MKNKNAIEMSFNWLFALIAGGFILALSIYGVMKIINTGTTEMNTETAAELISFLDPANAGIASGKVSPTIQFNKKTKIFLNCNKDLNPPFGKEIISTSAETFNKFENNGYEIGFSNKYVFSENVLEGKKIFVFSKSLKIAFKIADIIMMSDKKYCFYNAPNNIKQNIKELGIENIQFLDKNSQCSGIKVCFGSYTSCNNKDIIVQNINDPSYKNGVVKKQGKNLAYHDSLLYAAIMSSPEIYQCNVKRLMNKFNIVTDIYLGKINTVSRTAGCNSILPQELNILKSEAKQIEESDDLQDLYNFFENAKKAERIDKRSNCQIYPK